MTVFAQRCPRQRFRLWTAAALVVGNLTLLALLLGGPVFAFFAWRVRKGRAAGLGTGVPSGDEDESEFELPIGLGLR